ncbi:unnamed protein product [Dibothriocephalus latus]|uniref:BRCT domain-containing protein n=1 Tax=Dibothriocephalus latus TaxID=60516 RepID=A0A3P7P130_DIBLA|nr:unnamed protein product [Dibothriocephalus latus]
MPPPVVHTRLTKLFFGLGNVYIAPDTAPPSEALKELISLGGGTITRRLLVADLVVGLYDPKKSCVTPRWILGVEDVTDTACVCFTASKFACKFLQRPLRVVSFKADELSYRAR